MVVAVLLKVLNDKMQTECQRQHLKTDFFAINVLNKY